MQRPEKNADQGHYNEARRLLAFARDFLDEESKQATGTELGGRSSISDKGLNFSEQAFELYRLGIVIVTTGFHHLFPVASHRVSERPLYDLQADLARGLSE